MAGRLALLLLASVAAAPAAAQPDPAAAERGREALGLLLTGDPAALEPMLTPEMLAALGGRAGLARFAAELRRTAGNEVELVREALYEDGPHTLYYRQSRFERMPSILAQWTIASDGRIAGGWIGPPKQAAPTRFGAYRTKAALGLPFARPAEADAWFVTWGGRDPISNYHVTAPDQRFAYDFIAVRGRSPWRGDGRRNEDHYCWDEPVLAPAAGKVVRAVGDIPDNPRPGLKHDASPPPGNHVVIDHGKGERSLIAHFRAGSLAVREGQKVAAGALLGRCGNTGNSSQPHIHYHLQTGSAFGAGEGLPAFFNRYQADGAAVARGEPQRGQRVLPRE
jgi:hypothetical protein